MHRPHITYLTFSEVIELHDELCKAYGGPIGLLSRERLEASLAQPQMLVFGEERFATVLEKAAAYCYFIVLNHPFLDGNKRAGVAAAIHFMTVNGVTPGFDADALFQAVERVIAHKCDIEELARILGS